LTVLTVRFKNGTCEHWLGVPGPVERYAGKEVLTIGDRVFHPDTGQGELTMIDGRRIVSSGWEGYRAGVVPRDAGPTQVLECKRAFVAGAIVVLTAFKRVGEDDISEDAAVEIIAELDKDVAKLTAEMMATPPAPQVGN
jgi:hypothetical protein